MPHYFDPEPSAASDRRSVTLALPDLNLELATDRGVFSRTGIDPGTKLLLLEGPPPPAAGDVLDLGCGYGPIALTLARRSPAATIWAVDVNRRALALVEDNAASAGIDNVRPASPEDVPPEVRFAAIWSNPPVRVGKKQVHDMLRAWLRRLQPDGTACLVVHKHLGADSLARWLADEGFATHRLRSRMGYRLLEARRETTA